MNHYLLFLIGEPGAHDFVISAAYICYYYALLDMGNIEYNTIDPSMFIKYFIFISRVLELLTH